MTGDFMYTFGILCVFILLCELVSVLNRYLNGKDEDKGN